MLIFALIKMIKEPLYGKTLGELKEMCSLLGMPAFNAGQIAHWLYVKQVDAIDQMTNLSVKTREELKKRYDVGLQPFVTEQVSIDGTKKYLFKTASGHFIESVFIPEKDRATLCVSSQAGCKMACRFCMTGQQGFQCHLSTGEILNQIRMLAQREMLTNVVYMGMGEPFDNTDNVLKSLEILTESWGYAWSPKRITVSTIGVIPGMKEFLEKSKCHLAISLHTPFDEERKQLMPAQIKYPIAQVLNELKKYDLGMQRRVSFEYIVFKELNDSPAHIKKLVSMLGSIRCRVNLIRFHAIPGSPYKSPEDSAMIAFRDALNDQGIVATIRSSRGQDILAACGLLSTREFEK